MARKFTDRAVFSGETLTGAWEAPAGTTAVSVKLADGSGSVEISAEQAVDNVWGAIASAQELANLSGQVRWVVFATTPDRTEEIAHGSIYIRPLVSKYRAVVAAIESALQNYANNPNKQISVGELSITYKDRADLLDLLAYYRRRADADENGTAPAGGVQLIKTRFV